PDGLGTPLLDLFQDEGLDLRAVTIGHSNDTTDLDYLLKLAARGTTIGLDRYFMMAPEEERTRRAALALSLIQAGHAEQVCLSHDASPFYRFGTMPSSPECWLPVPREEVPWLRDHGASEDDIDAVLRRSVAATFEAAAQMATNAVPASR